MYKDRDPMTGQFRQKGELPLTRKVSVRVSEEVYSYFREKVHSEGKLMSEKVTEWIGGYLYG